MEAETKPSKPILFLPFQEAVRSFFAQCSHELAKEKFFYIFQALVICPTRNQAQLPDEDIALFFDQLSDLVSAAHELHQANKANFNAAQEDKSNG